MGLRQVHEDAMLAQGCRVVAGVDEVGRGPLAGPVVAAAVWVPDDVRVRRFLSAEAGDSKVLKAAKRVALSAFIQEHCRWALGEASVEEIDRVNIRNATFLAMERALAGLENCDGLLVDGNARVPGWKAPQRTVIKGDGCELAIACASIVAKVHRDAVMVRLGQDFPMYGWAKNAGYGTAVHLEALRKHGVCAHHRVSFAPVRAVVEAGGVARAA